MDQLCEAHALVGMYFDASPQAHQGLKSRTHREWSRTVLLHGVCFAQQEALLF